MATTIFFSWQIDRVERAGKDLIHEALELAASRISADSAVEPAVRDVAVDRDTEGVSDSPPIVDTIFHKIDQAVVFVPDLTFVGERVDGRPTPNPNVLIEYGWALNSLKHPRIVPVMNTAHGAPTPEAMPFDMRHLRNPTTYACPDGVDDGQRKRILGDLANKLEAQIRMVLDSEGGRFPGYDEIPSAEDSRGRFKPASEPIGIDSDFASYRVVHLASGPVCWFRLMPLRKLGRTFAVGDLEKAIKTPPLLPLNRAPSGWNFLRSADGFGLYSVNPGEAGRARSVVFAFTKGEIWSTDTVWLSRFGNGRTFVPNVEHEYRQTLIDYGQFLSRLDIRPPYKWIAGMENMKGRLLYAPTPPGHMRARPPGQPDGECTEQIVTESGVYSPGEPPGATLRSFFARLYDSCGISRGEWQDAG